MLTGNEKILMHAIQFLNSYAYRPVFTHLEKEILRPFFTNTDERVFFIHSLPEAVVDVLLSMYSRIKNPRGLRGVFVDSFLPLFLGSTLHENQYIYEGETERFLKDKKITSLEAFVNHSEETKDALRKFSSAFQIDPDYITKFAQAPKVKKFLNLNLDKYGHNSIARVTKLSLCVENISLLAAKSIEWGRAGTGYIELSTRYVDMSGKDSYPIEEEIACYGIDPKEVHEVITHSFDLYKTWQGEKFTGPFPQFLRGKYGHIFHDKKDLEQGVIGETCDVLGNFLPCATLTSVGVAISGEALPELLKHLLLENTPENFVLTHLIAKEAKKLGGDQFIRHFEPSEWKRASWEYLDSHSFGFIPQLNALGRSQITSSLLIRNEEAKRILYWSFRRQPHFAHCWNFNYTLTKLLEIPRGEFDKLPNHFEKVTADFSGIMSFRSWRDLQRQQYCAHYRTYVTPDLGFYHYNKPAPEEFFDACKKLWQRNIALSRVMKEHGVPPELAQYPLAIGNLIGFSITGNLAQMEFCNWQRTKFSVNHEVRQIFTAMETLLREVYPWWGSASAIAKVSRADLTPAYIFARTKEGIPLNQLS